MSKKYIVSEQRLRDLIEAEEKLCALNAGGVDNWSWYGESMRDYVIAQGLEDSDDPFEEIVDKEILNYQEKY